MKKIIILFTLIFLSTFRIHAQKYELDEVTVEELKQKVHPKDSSASAAVLFEKGRTYFEYKQDDGRFTMITEVEVKIKIYKKGGYDWANKMIDYYVGGTSDELVSFSKAVTYNLVNGSIVKTKLKSDGEFTEQKNKFWSQKKITMPNVAEGSIIEFKYTVKSAYYSRFPDWEFQKTIPVNHSEYITSIPEYFTYNVYRKGFVQPVETKARANKSITLNYNKLITNNSTATTTAIGKPIRSSEEIAYYDNQTTYKLDDLPALKEEGYVNNIKNYTAIIQHELSRMQMTQATAESFSTSWETVVKNIYESNEFGSQLRKEGYFDNDLRPLLAGITDRDQKIATIFNYVKSRMNWNNYYGYNCDNGVAKAYQDKTGNVAEINLMLTAMLRYAGVDASPVLISTRSNGIALFPSRTAFNYVIAAVEIQDALILLDATDKNAIPNILPRRDLNWFGRIVRKEGTSAEIDLMPKMLSKNHITLMASIGKTGEVEGKIKEQYSDYSAFDFRDYYGDVSKETYLEKLEKKNDNIEVGEYEVANKSDLSKPVIETYSFKHNNSVEIIGDKMYFSPLLFFTTTENPFKQEKREYPVDFVYPDQTKHLLIITIPEGYAVESIPAPIAIELEGTMGSFKFNISNTGNKIQVSSLFDVNTSIVPAEYYGDLKAFYTELIKKQTEKVILKKI